MNDKPIYMSRSFWGLIIAVFASVLPLFGVDWSQEDSETSLELIMAAMGGLGGLIGLIGVIKRKTTISLKGNSTKTLAGVVLVLIVPLALAGCAGQTAVEKAQTYGYETSNVYLNLDREYRAAYEREDKEDQAWLTENIRPLMVKVKAGLITYNDAVLIWSRLAQRAEQLGEDPDKYKPDDLENNKIRLNDLLYDIINLISKFR